MQKSTSILFFTRRVDDECASKNLFKNQRKNRKIQEAFYNTTISTITKSGINFKIVYDTSGSRQSFGEKLHQATASMFVNECEHLIIIGNDCPQLSSKALQDAAELLEKNETVIGPDKRGGIYLLGISKKEFNQINLINLPWQSENLCKSLINELGSSEYPISIMPSLRDVNFLEDVKKIANLLFSSHVLILVFNSIFLQPIRWMIFSSMIFSRNISYSGLRAPPVVA